jgi:transposase
MSNTFIVAIAESMDEIKERLNRQKTAKGKERLQMLYWLKQEKSIARKTLAKRLNRNESTIYRWLQKYQLGGIDGLLEAKVSSGPVHTIDGEALEKLKVQLAQQTGFASYGQIQQWLEQNCGLLIPYSTVHRRCVLASKPN